MSFAELAPIRVQEALARSLPRGPRFASDAGRLLVCKLVAFFADEGCRAMPDRNWLTVTVAGNDHAITLDVLDQHEDRPQARRGVPVRSVEEGRAAALLAGVLGEHVAVAA